MEPSSSPAAVVRRFNRFYTRQIGVLHENLLESPFSLTEVRILYELANQDRLLASELARHLGLDTGYLSRILRRFEARGLVRRTPSKTDARQNPLTLTPQGRRTFASLDAASTREIATMLEGLADADRNRLLGAMEAIEELLSGDSPVASPFIPAHPPARRHGLGGAGARPAVLARVRMERGV
jgi:DNA-binding MarR family transcriptional regulator